MIAYLIFIFLSFILIGVNNIISKKILYPPLFFSFLWVFIVAVHFVYSYFSDYSPNKLSYSTLLYFLIVIIFFSLGGILAKGLSKDKFKADVVIDFSVKVLNLLLLLNILFLILFILKAKQITGEYFNLLLYRYYTSVERVNIGLIKYSIPFSVFSSLLVFIKLYNKHHKSRVTKIKIYLVILTSACLTFLTGSRGSFFFLVLSYLGVYSVYNKINIKLIIKSVGIILIVFITMATILKKSSPKAHYVKSEYGAVEKVNFFMYSYSALPLSAFDKFFNEPYDIMYGDILFRMPKSLFYKVGIIDSPPKPLVEKYVNVPDRVNVYTAYYKLIKDFGVIYSIVFMTIVGFVHSYFFLNARKSFKYLIGFSVMLFPLTMSFFEENYVSILSTWIQISFYVILFRKLIIIKYE